MEEGSVNPPTSPQRQSFSQAIPRLGGSEASGITGLLDKFQSGWGGKLFIVSQFPSIALAVAMIVIGALHLNDCPIQPYIPIFLITAGAGMILQNSLSIGLRLRKTENPSRNPATLILGLFNLAWLITGSVWTYQLYGKVDYEKGNSKSYCQRDTYLLAFGFLTTVWSILGLFIVLISGALCCVCLAFICAMYGGQQDIE